MNPVEIALTYDFICPWCWIGHHHLKSAIHMAKLAQAPFLAYLPFELNPEIPKEGISRRAYRTAKFGTWARSQERDATVTRVGEQVGLRYDFARIEITPNTRLAHRLMQFAQPRADVQKLETLFESIFAAYFSRGADIGSVAVLADLAGAAGYPAEQVTSYLLGTEGDLEVRRAEVEAVNGGVSSVPTMRVGKAWIIGAQPPESIAESIRSAAAEQLASP